MARTEYPPVFFRLAGERSQLSALGDADDLVGDPTTSALGLRSGLRVSPLRPVNDLR
jgi:hypothetical protein